MPLNIIFRNFINLEESRLQKFTTTKIFFFLIPREDINLLTFFPYAAAFSS